MRDKTQTASTEQGVPFSRRACSPVSRGITASKLAGYTMHGILTALLLATVAGCEEKQVGVARGRGEGGTAFGVILSQEGGDHLRHDTALSPERVSRDPNGILHVAVPIRSAVEHTQYLEYQYSFFDASGTKVEGPFGWTPVTVEAGSPATIQFTSTSQQANEWQLIIRYQR